MKLYEKVDRHLICSKIYTGRYKGCQCIISDSSEKGQILFWYFVCMNKEDTIRYNSLWDGLKYQSCEECHDECVKYIDNQIKISK